MNAPSTSPSSGCPLGHVAMDMLRELHRLAVSRVDDFEALQQDYLETGCRLLGLETGTLSRIEGDRYTLLAVRSPFELVAGTRYPLGDTCCAQVVATGELVTIPRVGVLPEMRSHPIYTALALEAYIGAPIQVGGEIRGTIAFSDTRPRPQPFRDCEREFVSLMADALGRLIERSEAERGRQQAELELAASEERFRLAFQHAPVGMSLALPGGRFLRVNAALCEMLGYTEEELLKSDFYSITHPDDLGATQDLNEALSRGERLGFFLEKRYRHKSGRTIWAQLSVSLAPATAAYPACLVAQVVDITARKEAEEHLAVSEKRFRLLAEQSIDLISRHDDQGVYLYASPSCRTLLGYEPEELVGRNPYDLLHPDDLSQVREIHLSLLNEQGSRTVTYRLRRKDGSYAWLEATSTAVRVGDTVEIHADSRDVGERKRAEQDLKAQTRALAEANAELQRLSSTDPLTGLLNRRGFEALLEDAVDSATRSGRPLSLVTLDVDHFKDFNDRFGHPAGDEVLRQLGRIIRRVCRERDLGARPGGEEFSILLFDTSLEGARHFAERLRVAIEEDSWPLRAITASLGVATLDRSPDSTAWKTLHLIKQADRALYRAKGAGRNQVAGPTDLEGPA